MHTFSAVTMIDSSIEKILQTRVQGDPSSLATYKRLCRAFTLLHQWDEPSIASFIGQFYNCADLLDHTCTYMVAGLTHVDWSLLECSILSNFADFLVEIALKHVSHVEALLNCFISRFLPPVDNPTLDCPIYWTSHRSLRTLITTFPMCSSTTLRVLRRHFPHSSSNTMRYHAFVRNSLLATEYMCRIPAQIWALIIDNLLTLEAISAPKNVKDAGYKGIFVMDDGEQIESEISSVSVACREKLDLCMLDLFKLIGIAYNEQSDWLPETISQPDIYQTLKDVFEEHLLMAQDISLVSFLWFYMCALDKANLEDFLRWLWRMIVRPKIGQSMHKKAHGAACFLSGLLARATFVDVQLTLDWLTTMIEWATDFVNSHVGSNSTINQPSRATFYAVSQAIFLVFSFRYKEILAHGDAGVVAMRRWNLGHLVHSSLCPLRCCTWQVALCFAGITRSLQLVYCSHLLFNLPSTPSSLSFFFPFDPYSLPLSAPLIRPFYRSFSPLTSDPALSNDRIRCYRNRVSSRMDDDDFLLDISVPDKSMNDYLLCYGTSPGLAHMEVKLSQEDLLALRRLFKCSTDSLIDHERVQLARLLDTGIGTVSSVKILAHFLSKDVTLHVHQLLDRAQLILPHPEPPPIRNPELETRVELLRKEQQNREYRRMTRNVDSDQRFGRNGLLADFGRDVRSTGNQSITVFNTLLTVGGAFMFGFFGIDYAYSNARLDLPIKLLLGFVFATIVFFADLYFIVKDMNRDEQQHDG